MSFFNKQTSDNLALAKDIMKQVNSTSSASEQIINEASSATAAKGGRSLGLMRQSDEPNEIVQKLLAEGARGNSLREIDQNDGGNTVIELFDTLLNSWEKQNTKVPNNKSVVFAPEDDIIDVVPDIVPASLVSKPKKETTKTTSTVSPEFNARIRMLESSDDDTKQITTKKGKLMTGALQFSEARLIDAKKALDIKFTTEEFKNSPELQRTVEAWHFKDIDRVIDSMGKKTKGYNRNGLRLVAHLGGITGMKNFVNKKLEGKEYNPKDDFGTKLQDYYDEHKTIEDYSATA